MLTGKNNRKLAKKALCLIFAFLLSINSFAAIVSDNDGSAFVTKAEFEALKKDFADQVDNYNDSIDRKIDGAIASYLAGIAIKNREQEKILFSSLENITSLDLESDSLEWKDLSPAGAWSVDVFRFADGVGSQVQAFDQTFDDLLTTINNNARADYWLSLNFEPPGWEGKGCLISNLDKANGEATWEGYSKKITAWMICTNSYINNALGIMPLLTDPVDFDWHVNTRWYEKDYPIENSQVLQTVTVSEGLTMTRQHYLRSYSEKYEDITYENAILWKSKSCENFITKDETLGFGNANPYGDGTRPNAVLTDNFTYDAKFAVRYVSQDSTDPNYNKELRHVGNRPKNYLRSATTIVYSGTNVFPGKKFAKAYVNNYNQLIHKNIKDLSSGSSMHLYKGFPLCEVNDGEKVEWPVRFTDTGNYEFVASLQPFDDTMDDDTNWINISKDETNYDKKVTIENGNGKLYFDFQNHGSAPNGSIIYIKWHKTDTSSYNGGGTIDLKNCNEVTIIRE